MLRSVTICTVQIAIAALLAGAAGSIAGEGGESYVYPVRPEDSQWRELKSFSEMLEVCQVPEELLKQLPTQQLAEVCMDYPLIGIYIAYSDATAVDVMASGFNGLGMLLSRDDAGAAVAHCYQQAVAQFVAPEAQADVGTLATDRFANLISIGFMERLLAHQQILSSIDERTAIEILRAVQAKYHFFESLSDREQWVRSISAYSGGRLVLRTVDVLVGDSDWAQKFGPVRELCLQMPNDSSAAVPSPVELAQLMHLVESALQE